MHTMLNDEAKVCGPARTTVEQPCAQRKRPCRIDSPALSPAGEPRTSAPDAPPSVGEITIDDILAGRPLPRCSAQGLLWPCPDFLELPRGVRLELRFREHPAPTEVPKSRRPT